MVQGVGPALSKSIIFNRWEENTPFGTRKPSIPLRLPFSIGTKLSEQLYDAGVLIKRTDYLGEFVFENNALKLIHHEEGRVLPDDIDGGFEYQYDLRDHLGNNRVTFSNKPKSIQFKVNYENNSVLPDDIALFEATTPISSNDFMDHTDQQEGTVTQNLYSHSQLLNGSEGQRIGTVIALPVATGDKITAEAYAKYINPTTTGVGTVTALGTALIGAFTGSGDITSEMSGSINGSYTGTNGSLIGTAGFGYEDPAAPKAFLNVLFLPESEVVNIGQSHFAFDQIAATAEQSTGPGAVSDPFDHLIIQDFEAPARGYVIVYVSNENDTHVDVHFDDLQITINQKEVVQSQDYYPYGLTFNQYKRVGRDKNEYLYQGKEELEGTDWYDFYARSYHAGLGRFMSVDPKGQFVSGYVGMGNNPINGVDPDGEEFTVLTAMAIAAIVSATSYTASIALSDGGFNNWDWGQFTEGVVIGTWSGAVTFGIGEAFQVAYGTTLTTGQQALKTAVHASFQGGLSSAQGGDFWNAFGAGAVGSIVGLGTNGLTGAGGNIASIGSAMLLGGVTSDLSGGDFWKGAAISGIVAGANHVAHRIGDNLTDKIKDKKAEQQDSQNERAGACPDCPKQSGIIIPDNEFGYDEGNMIREGLGVGMLEAGRPTVDKRFVTKGTSTSVSASSKSSKATKFFSRITKRQFKKAVRTPTGYPLKNFRWTRTTSVAKFFGRWTPFVGGTLLVYDAMDLSYKAIQSFTNDSIRGFFDQSRQNVTSVGMYHKD